MLQGWVGLMLTSSSSMTRYSIARRDSLIWDGMMSSQLQKILFLEDLNPQYYFLHSYYMVPEKLDHILATSNYGVEFASAIRRDNVFGTQFHPEKSHEWGCKLLKNFAELD